MAAPTAPQLDRDFVIGTQRPRSCERDTRIVLLGAVHSVSVMDSRCLESLIWVQVTA